MKSVWLIFICIAFAIKSCAAKEHVALMELSYGNTNSTVFTETSAIFDQAVADLREKYASVMNITSLRVHNEDPVCYSERFTFLAARDYYREVSRSASAGIFFPGHACSMRDSLADLTREWNVPLFTSAGADWEISTKINRFPNQIRLGSLSWPDFLSNILKKFGYTTVGVLCTDDVSLRLMCNAFTNLMTSPRYNVNGHPRRFNGTVRRFDVNNSDSTSLERSLEEIRSATRVVVLIAPDNSIRRIMMAAFDKGMTDGNYVYLTFDNYNRGIPTFLRADHSNERSQDAHTAFRSLFTISQNIQNTSEYHNFTEEVKRLSKDKYGKAYDASEEVSIRGVPTYFAIAIYGQVLNESIANSKDTRDGAALVRLMQNRTFTILGNEIIINSNGDRESNWVLNQMDPVAGIYRPVLTDSDAGTSIRPFRDPLDKSIRPIVWFNRTGPPPNEPKCGYEGANPACNALDSVVDNVLSI